VLNTQFDAFYITSEHRAMFWIIMQMAVAWTLGR
jgi:hypothetical protein